MALYQEKYLVRDRYSLSLIKANKKMEYIKAKTLVTRTKDRTWFGTRYNMNIYKGCSHGCIYCDSRSLCYRIEDFEKVRVKEDALHILRNELKGRLGKGVIGTGAMSDPYNPLENDLGLTRGALELMIPIGLALQSQLKVI